MNIGMVCYASVGGSGVVATELAHALARRGHQVHLISSEPPFRWRSGVPGLSFVPVEVPPYPLFREPQYLLALTNDDRACRGRAAARHRARALRGAARDGGVSRRADARRRRLRSCRRARSRRCTAPTSRWSAATRRTRERWRSRSSSRTASPLSRRACKADTVVVARHPPRHHGDSEFSRLRGVPRGGRIRRCARGSARPIATTPWSFTSRTSGRSSGSTSRSRCFAGSASAFARGSSSSATARFARTSSAACGIIGLERRRRVRWASSRIWSEFCRAPICSCCRRRRRASALPRWKPWRARCRSSPRTSAACRRSSRMASPDSSARLRPWTLMAERGVALLTDASLRRSIAAAAVRLVQARYCTDSVVPFYETEYLEVLRRPVAAS